MEAKIVKEQDSHHETAYRAGFVGTSVIKSRVSPGVKLSDDQIHRLREVIHENREAPKTVPYAASFADPMR